MQRLLQCNIGRSPQRPRVPVDSEWKQLGRVYYHPDIREVPDALTSPSAKAPESSEQLLTTQAALPSPRGFERTQPSW